jgi:prepilin signal peptidase PulO-like enzyme (type II secretory pathway)
MMEVSQSRDDRSLGELFGELTREITTLVRQEATLAKTEMSQKASRIGKHVGMMALGGAVVYAGLLALLAGIISTLAQQTEMTWWGSALLVGAIVAGLGGFLVWKGLDALKHTDLAPRETIETLKEDKQWLRGQAG